MNFLLRRVKSLAPVLALSALATLPASARANGLSLQAQVLHPTEVASSGAPTLGDTHRAVVGSEVVYQVRYAYTGSDPASLVITNPFPSELLFLPNASQQSDARLEVSVDGGAHFGVLKRLRVGSGTSQSRPARATDVTHVRWVLDEPVQPGTSGTVSLRARIR